MNKNEIINLVNTCEKELNNELNKIDYIVEQNTLKVMDAFKICGVSEVHFNSTTGYGYGDIGRDVIEKVYSKIFNTESALVRNQFISASHALTVALFAILRPNDTMLSMILFMK